VAIDSAVRTTARVPHSLEAWLSHSPPRAVRSRPLPRPWARDSCRIPVRVMA